MTTNATDETDDRAVEADRTNRYAELNIGGQEFVIYDRKNHQAWIQSTAAITADELR